MVREADLTDAVADHALRQAARNAPVPSDPNNRKTGFVVRFGLNLVRWTIDLVVNHENEIAAAAAGGFAASLLTAGGVATGGTTLGALGLAWLLAKNVKDNEAKWRKIAESAKVTSQNFDLLIEKLNKLPLD